MSQTPNDPAGTTHQFQNFADQAQPQPQKPGVNVGLLVGIAAVTAVVMIIVAAVIMM